MPDGEDSGGRTARARLARAGWTALAAAPGLACAFAGGRGAIAATVAAAALASAAALAPDAVARWRSARHAGPGRVPAPPASAGVLARDVFFRRVEGDIAGGELMGGVLGVFHLADAERLATFDAAAADRLLGAFEGRLRAAVDAAAPIARMRQGGFAVWLAGADGEAGAARLQAVVDGLGRDGYAASADLAVAAATFPRDGRDAGALLRCADALLAVGGPGGAVATAASPAAAAARDRFSLTAELHDAMARDELRLQFQPVIDVAAGRVAGAEALLRWTSAARGSVSPSAFVPLLEESGLIEAVGLWVLDAACRQLAAWSFGPLAPVTVAVNVSARQFRDGRLPRLVAERLERHGVAPARLELELTETAAVEDQAGGRRLIGELAELGVGVASDDFGRGWSSISHLRSLPFSKLKIDREFVNEIDARPESQAICRSVLELGRGLGMTVLAEGVERREEVETLRAMGCRLFQGYWFSRPLEAEAFAARAADPMWLAGLGAPAAAPPLRVVRS